MVLYQHQKQNEKNPLERMTKTESAYALCVGMLEDLGVCDETGRFLLSERKNAPLFACVQALYRNQRKLFKRPLSESEILGVCCQFLQVETRKRINGYGI